MATNKRKDAAALFELIDKSTLKVPKGAGSLRIPSWWSSKTNNVVSGGATVSGQSSVVSGQTTVSSQSSVVSGGAVAGDQKPEAGEQTNAVQHRLFEPPPANAEGTVSPSIRPPGREKPEAPPPRIQKPEEDKETRGPGDKETGGQGDRGTGGAGDKENIAPSPGLPVSVSSGPAVSGTGQKIFAPQTMKQVAANRPQWSGGSLKLARAPGWVLVAGAAAGVMVLVLIIWVVIPKGGVKTPAPGGAAGAGRMVTPGAGGATVGNAGQGARVVAPANTDNGEGAMGKVYEPGTVQRSAELYYVWIVADPSEKKARENAALLAAHGIDVSIEVLGGKKPRTYLYQLISVKGFPTIQAAGAYREKIAQIGHLTESYRLTRRAWDDAAIKHVYSPPPAAPAPAGSPASPHGR